MSFLKRLFGAGTVGGGKEAATPAASAETEYNGYTIRAAPFAEEGQYQTCGVISKEIDGVMKEHRFIRADRFPSADDAAAHSLRKAKQLIDEQGDAIFR